MKKTIIICATAILCFGMLSYAIYITATKNIPTSYTLQTQNKNDSVYASVVPLGYCNDMMYCLDQDTGAVYAMRVTIGGSYRVYKFLLANATSATK